MATAARTRTHRRAPQKRGTPHKGRTTAKRTQKVVPIRRTTPLWLRDVELRYVQCRTVRHAWYEYPDDRPAPFGWRFSNRCERCTTVRSDLYDDFGRLLSRSYQYPDGYKLAHKVTQEQLRLEIRRRRGLA